MCSLNGLKLPEVVWKRCSFHIRMVSYDQSYWNLVTSFWLMNLILMNKRFKKNHFPKKSKFSNLSICQSIFRSIIKTKHFHPFQIHQTTQSHLASHFFSLCLTHETFMFSVGLWAICLAHVRVAVSCSFTLVRWTRIAWISNKLMPSCGICSMSNQTQQMISLSV